VRSTWKQVLALAVAITAVLSLTATDAFAHRGGKRLAAANAGALVTEAAKQLGVTEAKLTGAITDAAVARIDEAVEDEDIDAEDAEALKERAEENVRYAMAISRTKAVASNLGVTTAKLNTGFRDARKALALVRIDQALEDGDIDEEEAAERKAAVAAKKFAGYKAGGLGAFRAGGPGGGGGCGGGRGR
jgi:F0F1-type ATP synthase epsilon subunit